MCPAAGEEQRCSRISCQAVHERPKTSSTAVATSLPAHLHHLHDEEDLSRRIVLQARPLRQAYRQGGRVRRHLGVRWPTKGGCRATTGAAPLCARPLPRPLCRGPEPVPRNSLPRWTQGDAPWSARRVHGPLSPRLRGAKAGTQAGRQRGAHRVQGADGRVAVSCASRCDGQGDGQGERQWSGPRRRQLDRRRCAQLSRASHRARPCRLHPRRARVGARVLLAWLHRRPDGQRLQDGFSWR